MGKDKSDLDFDFSDISGGVTEKLRVEKPKPNVKKTFDDPILCVPMGQGWVDRSLTECTPKEFIRWFEFVHPGVICEEKDFVTRADRLNAFKYKIQYSIQMCFKNIEEARIIN